MERSIEKPELKLKDSAARKVGERIGEEDNRDLKRGDKVAGGGGWGGRYG